MTAFDGLSEELDRWNAKGIRPRFWLRDDDAVADTGVLRRLMTFCADHGVVPNLAVIPARAEASGGPQQIFVH